MEINYFCPTCGASNRLEGDPGTVTRCGRCSSSLALVAPPLEDSVPVSRCVVCGDDKLYVQKRFAQKWGCLIIAVGAVLVPWTYGLSLGVFALVDLVLYRTLPNMTVCYVCGSRYRGAPIHPDHGPYDLMTAQTYEARSINWRKRHDRSAHP